MQTVKIGNVEIAPLLDSNLLMDPRVFMPAHADEFTAEFGHMADGRGLYGMSVTTFLIRSAGQTILVDSGLGNRRRPGFPLGQLDVHLKEAGISPDDIDFVVHTHLHIDHVGWNTYEDANGETQFFFPKAKHLIQQAEWDYWMTPARMAANPVLVECVTPLAGSGRVIFQSPEQAINENVVFVPTPGHTPGHSAIGIGSQGERAIIVGDASHHFAQLNHPDWSPSFDIDPHLSALTRTKLFDDAIADGRTWIAGHWPTPGIGQILRVDGKRTFKAL